MNTRQFKKELERYKNNLQKTGLNKYARKQLLKEFKASYEEFTTEIQEIRKNLDNKRVLLEYIQPYQATRKTSSNKPFTYEVKTRHNKGIVSRKCHIKA